MKGTRQTPEHLVRLFADIDLAAEAVQEAFVAAVERWPSAGLPPSRAHLTVLA